MKYFRNAVKNKISDIVSYFYAFHIILDDFVVRHSQHRKQYGASDARSVFARGTMLKKRHVVVTKSLDHAFITDVIKRKIRIEFLHVGRFYSD